MRWQSPTGLVSRFFRLGVLLLAVMVGTAVPAQGLNPYEGPPISPPQGRIDELVFGRLKSLGIEPARLCSDAVFVRRVYLDAIGTLPTAQETRTFLSDQDPARRGKLIDRLLQRNEFADYWAMKWCDLLRVKSEFPINLWPNAVQSYHRWIRTSLKENLPYDRFVQAMLTASGSNFRVPQVNFYRAMQGNDPRTIAKTVALTFMGTRADAWPAERLTAMAAFFSRLGVKSTAEWKEQILFDDPGKTSAGAFSVTVFPDGTPARLAPNQDPRDAFANWLTAPENPWFARSIANRVWSWLLGRGLVQEPDDLRPDNPPSNPELLALLEHELVGAHYDLKHLFRLILNSQAYQLSSVPRTRDPAGEANFASYPLRRIEAEVLIDAIDQIRAPFPSRSPSFRRTSARSPWRTGASQVPFSSCSAAPRATPASSPSATTARPPPKACTFSTQAISSRRSPRVPCCARSADLRVRPRGRSPKSTSRFFPATPPPRNCRPWEPTPGPARPNPARPWWISSGR
jgi:hypothetical protein